MAQDSDAQTWSGISQISRIPDHVCLVLSGSPDSWENNLEKGNQFFHHFSGKSGNRRTRDQERTEKNVTMHINNATISLWSVQ